MKDTMDRALKFGVVLDGERVPCLVSCNGKVRGYKDSVFNSVFGRDISVGDVVVAESYDFCSLPIGMWSVKEISSGVIPSSRSILFELLDEDVSQFIY